MDNDVDATASVEAPRLGEAGFYCVELCCGSGNLTFAMKHFFPDSFGIDHKVGKVETHKVMKTLLPIKGKFEICLPLFLRL